MTSVHHETPERTVSPSATPTVLIAIRHRAMSEFTRELLDRHLGSSTVIELGGGELLKDALERLRPDLLVIDAGNFPECCEQALARYPSERVIVIGPEPHDSYRSAALAAGAASWVPRDRIGDDLVAEAHALLSVVSHHVRAVAPPLP
ncbi:MAG: hypothetical protein M0013_05135 [Actinomycetota bacterium]|nr:hypothetical protein [Actinomycetota bacterium]